MRITRISESRYGGNLRREAASSQSTWRTTHESAKYCTCTLWQVMEDALLAAIGQADAGKAIENR